MEEQAPEYTRKEKIGLVFGRYIWIFLVFLVIHVWIFPGYENFVDDSLCKNFGPFLGAEIVLYGLYVAMPFLVGVPFLVFGYLRARKVIQKGQDPLPGEKVWKARTYVYGWRAHIRYSCALLAFCFLFSVAVYNMVSYDEVIRMAVDSNCTVEPLTKD